MFKEFKYNGLPLICNSLDTRIQHKNIEKALWFLRKKNNNVEEQKFMSLIMYICLSISLKTLE